MTEEVVTKLIIFALILFLALTGAAAVWYASKNEPRDKGE